MRGEQGAGARLAIDALAARFGGTVHVVAELARRLAADPSVAAVLVITRPGSLLAGVLDARPGLEIHEVRGSRAELSHRLLWEALRLPRLLRRWRADALLTVSGMLPRDVGVPVVSYLCNPVAFEAGGAANTLRRRAMARTARRARDVIAPTRAMAGTAGAAIGRTVGVVEHGIDRSRFHPAPAAGEEVLVVGDFYVHKRHDLALAAWEQLPAPRPPLLMVGDMGVDARHGHAVRAAADRLGPLGSVRVQDRVEQGELAELYRRARVLLLPSEHESFAMPLAEALACGVPAVCRDRPVLRETAGPGALFVDGDDPAEWSRALRAVLEDDALHARLRADGMAHAARLDWDAAADAVRERLIG